VLRYLPEPTDPHLLGSFSSLDDAVVYRLDEDRGLVQSVDFITPVVDDPYTFGAVAAANALSDLYAMGARPLFALNVVGFPIKTLSPSTLGAILRGGAEKVMEAGAFLAGGHSVDNHEPKYGLVVTGVAPLHTLVRNSGARPGDRLVLTKPLGIGIITTGIDRGMTNETTIQRVVQVMETLNKGAAEAMLRVGVHACTDVTGFGLLGHLREMAAAGNVGARLFLERVPVLDETWNLAAQGSIPDGTYNNLHYLADYVAWGTGISRDEQIVLCDAQTSGGLLMAVPPERVEALLVALEEESVPAAAVIGEVTTEVPGGRIQVER